MAETCHHGHSQTRLGIGKAWKGKRIQAESRSLLSWNGSWTTWLWGSCIRTNSNIFQGLICRLELRISSVWLRVDLTKLQPPLMNYCTKREESNRASKAEALAYSNTVPRWGTWSQIQNCVHLIWKWLIFYSKAISEASVVFLGPH